MFQKSILYFCSMTTGSMKTIELRSEIHKAIENVPASFLPEILKYINSIQSSSTNNDDLDQFIDRVFKEDDNLLRRLAQ